MKSIIHQERMEVMAPVGSHESLSAALQAGADSVYFGAGKLNMRARSANNFRADELGEIAGICSDRGVKTYLTLNTVIYDQEAEEMKHMVDAACKAGITAIIASDMAVLAYAREAGIEIHISTQCNITNTEAVKFFAAYADVMVCARELDLMQVSEINRAIREQGITGPSGKPVRTEVFAHGALCMAVSGKCYMSLDLFNQSANRGACYQPCRRSYLLTDADEGYEIRTDHEYLMSPKDLCTIGFLDRIAGAGVSLLKIEGRGRSADYVKATTACYREAAESLIDGTYGPERVDIWMERLKRVYNRGFWDGYYLGRKLGEWSGKYGSQASVQKLYVGKVTNYFSKLKVAEIRLETHEVLEGDRLLITGPTSGVVELTAEGIRVDHKPVTKSIKGEDFSVALEDVVRRGDKVYKLVSL